MGKKIVNDAELKETENGFIIISEKNEGGDPEFGRNFDYEVVFNYKGKVGQFLKSSWGDNEVIHILYDGCIYKRAYTNGEIEERSTFTDCYDAGFVIAATKEFGVHVRTEDELAEIWEKENPKSEEEDDVRDFVTLTFSRTFPNLKRGLWSARKMSDSLREMTYFIESKDSHTLKGVVKAFADAYVGERNNNNPTMEVTPDYVLITSASGYNTLKFESFSGEIRLTWTVKSSSGGGNSSRAATKHGWGAQ